MAPKPPDVRRAPAQPGRSLDLPGGPEMAPKPPDVRRAPAQPGRSSFTAGNGGWSLARSTGGSLLRSSRAGGAGSLLVDRAGGLVARGVIGYGGRGEAGR